MLPHNKTPKSIIKYNLSTHIYPLPNMGLCSHWLRTPCLKEPEKRFWCGTFSDHEIFAPTDCSIGKGPESKLEMCFIYTLNTESEGNFIQFFQRPIFQLWPITRNRCGILHSQCPASSQSFRFPIFRVERPDFYQTSPIHTGSPSLFWARRKAKQ